MESETARARRWLCCLRLFKISLLLAVLVFHFLSRQQTAKTMFQQVAFYHETMNYPDCFRCSLGLLAGQGFCRIGFPGDRPLSETDTWLGHSVENSEISNPPAQAKPVIDFFNLPFQRWKITSDEFQAYLKTPASAPIQADLLDGIRILDIRLTALLWKAFGMSWGVYFTFASLVSSLSCLVIFMITRKLSGSYWAGIIAGILFLAFPFENQQAIRSVRDISPLWFATLAFGFFICVVDSFQVRIWNYLTYLALGVLAVIGMGWRRDALLVAPLLFVGLAIFLLAKHRHWKPSLIAACLFVLGAAGMHAFIESLGPRNVDASGVIYHPALYGEASRCNLMGLENSFQIPREDLQTVFNAVWFQHAVHPNTPGFNEKLGFLDRRYGVTCREMYIATMKYHLFQYLRYWPEFYWHGLGALSQPGQLQGEDVGLLRQSRLPWALPIYAWCLDYLVAIMPILHFLGILTFYWVGRERIRGSFLILFSFYYSVIWFAVLPEQKHFGQMLLPLAMTGAMGLWGLAKALGFLFLRFDLRDLHVAIPKQLRIVGYASCGFAALWLLACLIAYPYSVRHRDNLVNEIVAVAARAADAKEHIKDPRVFSSVIDPRTSSSPKGYLLTVQAGSKPGLLTCRHVQFPTREKQGQVFLTMPGRVFVTHHKLYPGRGQYFAVSCVHSQSFGGDVRPYVCTVTVPAGCSITACRELDLSSWKRLPFSTVFCDGEHLPGSPIVGAFGDGQGPSDRYFDRYTFNNLSSEIAYAYPWELLTGLGLPREESIVESASASHGPYSRQNQGKKPGVNSTEDLNEEVDGP